MVQSYLFMLVKFRIFENTKKTLQHGSTNFLNSEILIIANIEDNIAMM